MHGIFEFVMTEPIETVPFERLNPAFGHVGAIVGRLRGHFAFGMVGPGCHAATTRIAIGIDVDGNAEKMIGHFDASIRIGAAKSTNCFGRIG